MGKGFFFSPTIPKLIIPFSLFIIFIFIALQKFCCLPIMVRLILAMSNPEYLGIALFTLLIAYYFSCSVFYFIDGKVKPKKK